MGQQSKFITRHRPSCQMWPLIGGITIWLSSHSSSKSILQSLQLFGITWKIVMEFIKDLRLLTKSLLQKNQSFFLSWSTIWKKSTTKISKLPTKRIKRDKWEKIKKNLKGWGPDKLDFKEFSRTWLKQKDQEGKGHSKDGPVSTLIKYLSFKYTKIRSWPQGNKRKVEEVLFPEEKNLVCLVEIIKILITKAKHIIEILLLNIICLMIMIKNLQEKLNSISTNKI